jgi:Holliday junction DNA helicase RuvA
MRIIDSRIPLRGAAVRIGKCVVIALLKGIVAAYGEDTLVLDVQGVGYEVHCSSRTLTTLPSVGEAATIHVETVVREDMIRLYGFQSELEKSWFAC